MVYDDWSRLPLPTPEQTARFAEHVADNHSWYKHLPFYPPGASFAFFGNLHAGRGMRSEGERLVPNDLQHGDYFDHHSRLPTAEYIDRFGHWDYWVDNPRVFEPQQGPWLYSADGRQRVLLPDEIKRLCSCRLTACLRPSPLMFTVGLQNPPEAEAFAAFAKVHSGDDEVLRYQSVAEEFHRAGTWQTPVLLAFMESEGKEQRQRLLDTLNLVRELWAEQ